VLASIIRNLLVAYYAGHGAYATVWLLFLTAARGGALEREDRR